MAVFNWIASDAARSIKPSVYSAKMGDGYEQNTPTGLNFLPETWELQFKCRTGAIADAILAFLKAQGGYQKFQWTPPRANAPIFIDSIDEPIGLIDPTGPKARKIFTQGFRLADPLEWTAHCILDQAVDAFQGLTILLLPVEIIVPCSLGPREQTSHPRASGS